MQRTIIIAFILISTALGQSSLRAERPEEPLPPLPEGPMILTSATPAMMRADFWINRLSDPDKVLKTPEQLAKLNEEIDLTIHERVNLFQWSPPTGKEIRRQIELEYNTIANRKLFDVKDKYYPKSFFEEKVKPLVASDGVPHPLKLRWGAAVRSTSVRALPTWEKMLEEKGDVEFDQLQFTLIKLWTPVAIYHESSDGKWYYVQAPYVRGWVESKDIAIFPSKNALKQKVKSESFIVVTGESVRIYADSDMKHKLYRASMGTVIPLENRDSGIFVVTMPGRSDNGAVKFRKGYIKRSSDVSVGFPAFTQRNILKQAFKLLGVRYGWGGMYDGRDCSGFTHDVFLSMGVDMPRDSDQQAMVGTLLGRFEPYKQAEDKTEVLRRYGVPGITILKMPMHIMLYLGELDGRFYIIHSTWAERIGQDPIKDEKRRVNQVVVTDMGLNGNSYIGSLFDRTIAVNKVN